MRIIRREDLDGPGRFEPPTSGCRLQATLGYVSVFD
jgi:hypothetical protein